MKNALISPNEPVSDQNGAALGWRVAQVEIDGETFPVGAPLFWTSCADDVVADKYYYDPNTLAISQIPGPTEGLDPV